MARRHTIRLDAPVSDAQFHPRNAGILLVSLGVNEVYLVDLRPGGGKNRVEDVGEIAEPDAEGQGEGEGSSTERERKKWVVGLLSFRPSADALCDASLLLVSLLRESIHEADSAERHWPAQHGRPAGRGYTPVRLKASCSCLTRCLELYVCRCLVLGSRCETHTRCCIGIK